MPFKISATGLARAGGAGLFPYTWSPTTGWPTSERGTLFMTASLVTADLFTRALVDIRFLCTESLPMGMLIVPSSHLILPQTRARYLRRGGRVLYLVWGA